MRLEAPILATLLMCSSALAQPLGPATDRVLANRIFTVTDDFIVDVYHNGERVPDTKRTLLHEVHGATAERIDIDVRESDWLVFNVVNNRLRWGGCSYFAVTGRGDAGVAFTTDPDSVRWSCCDETELTYRFIHDRTYLAGERAQAIANPWADGDGLMKHIADGWAGRPVWGKSRNTWIKFVAR
jgi:hypothetical protein